METESAEKISGLEQALNNSKENSSYENEALRLKEELAIIKASYDKKQKKLSDRVEELATENKKKEQEIIKMKIELKENLNKKPELRTEVTTELKKDILKKMIRIEDLVDEFLDLKNLENLRYLDDAEIKNKLQDLNKKTCKFKDIL